MIVAIVGRPNVGKSTLFNRMVGGRAAIVDATEGTTRDRHYGKTDWNGREFTVIDTGGFTVNSEDIFEKEICRQVEIAIQEADVVVFMVDVEVGITDLDQAMANILRRVKKPVIMVVNKVDNSARNLHSFEFYGLGLGEPFTVSSMSGSGTGEVMDAIVEALPNEKEQEIAVDEEGLEIKKVNVTLPRITVVGRPNVGKSSLTNALLGVQRNIVTPIAGTTRDAIDSYYNKFGYEFTLIDTAGLRKKQKVNEDLEFYSVLRSIRAIENSDVVIMMLDASNGDGVDAQDMNIFHLIVKNKKGCVIVINKWDLVENKQTNTARDFADNIKRKLAPFNDVPIIFTSVTDKQRIFDVVKSAMQVYENRKRRVPTSQLNEFILPIIEQTPPPAVKGKYIRIKYATMLPSPTPSFAFFVNLPQYIKDPYRRFLENKIRAQWDYTGCPLQIFFRQK
ncbi:GTP-binding protein EngA [Mucinivorans hirudinis]|uniref:GTPase Der n=1 Tax=Mucinivorans hirudinis TaxID=1433126 RepID=A0A060RBX6_9BACT|nr:GTP-binding protein EngA [Mucinivorans hirudinis]